MRWPLTIFQQHWLSFNSSDTQLSTLPQGLCTCRSHCWDVCLSNYSFRSKPKCSFPGFPVSSIFCSRLSQCLFLHGSSWFVAPITYSPNADTPKESSSFDDYQMSASLFQFHSWLRGERDPPSYFGDLEIEAQEETLSEVPWLVGSLVGWTVFQSGVGCFLLK